MSSRLPTLRITSIFGWRLEKAAMMKGTKYFAVDTAPIDTRPPERPAIMSSVCSPSTGRALGVPKLQGPRRLGEIQTFRSRRHRAHLVHRRQRPQLPQRQIASKMACHANLYARDISQTLAHPKISKFY